MFLCNTDSLSALATDFMFLDIQSNIFLLQPKMYKKMFRLYFWLGIEMSLA